MGLLDSITGAIVLRYKAETDQAKAKIRELSGEQKKAAKEAADALEAQGKAAEGLATKWAKGAAVIAGTYMVARDGWKAYREDARLTAGAVGVDIGRLSAAYDGLKTRTDLLTLAQAGHRGAWKLTTGQIEQVIGGMRALEKQGFDAQKVFEKFTEILHKGKLEGLDDFGLSLKSTGDQTKDLQVLLNALRGEVRQVGGDFEMAGDGVARAMVKVEDGILRVRIALGRAIDDGQKFMESLGASFGREVFGSQPEDVGPGGKASAYAQAFGRRGAPRIGGGRTGSGTVIRGLGGVVNNFADDIGPLGGWTSALASSDTYLFGGPDEAAQKAGASLAKFSNEVRQAMQGRGPLATASPQEFAEMIVGLPQGWRAVDEELGKRVDELSASLAWRLVKGMGSGGGQGGAPAMARGRGGGRGGGGRGKGAELGPGLIFGAARTAFGALSAVADYENAQNESAAAAALQDEVLQQRWAASMEQNRRFLVDFEAMQADAEKAKKESFLTKVFGPIEDFDAYGNALTTLGDLAQGVWGSMLTSIANGEALSGKAIRKAIGDVLAAKAMALGADGLNHVLRGTVRLATGDPKGALEIAGGTAMMAGAAVVAGIASKIGGGSAGAVPTKPGAGGGAGGARTNDGGGPGSGQNYVVLGSTFEDQSPRQRARQVYRAISNVATVYRPPEGSS